MFSSLGGGEYVIYLTVQKGGTCLRCGSWYTAAETAVREILTSVYPSVISFWCSKKGERRNNNNNNNNKNNNNKNKS
jgi:hypothetical protein